MINKASIITALSLLIVAIGAFLVWQHAAADSTSAARTRLATASADRLDADWNSITADYENTIKRLAANACAAEHNEIVLDYRQDPDGSQSVTTHCGTSKTRIIKSALTIVPQETSPQYPDFEPRWYAAHPADARAISAANAN